MDTSFAVLEGVSTLASGREAAPDVVRYLQSPQLADLADGAGELVEGAEADVGQAFGSRQGRAGDVPGQVRICAQAR